MVSENVKIKFGGHEAWKARQGSGQRDWRSRSRSRRQRKRRDSPLPPKLGWAPLSLGPA